MKSRLAKATPTAGRIEARSRIVVASQVAAGRTLAVMTAADVATWRLHPAVEQTDQTAENCHAHSRDQAA